MVKARKHRRVIALSNVDLALKQNSSDAQVVANNLSSNSNISLELVNKKPLSSSKRKSKKSVSAVSDHDKFLLEQCPPHFGKI